MTNDTKQEVSGLPFKTFPEFSKLTLNDRKAFEKVVAGYPPIMDLSFGGLMNWWNVLGGLSISQLNENLVISYWIPGLERFNGLSIIGENRLDESICTIFDHQIEKGEKPRLVNVPEFVTEHIRNPQLFTFKNNRSLDEYIFSVAKFYPLAKHPYYRRQRIKRFISDWGRDNIVVRLIDLGDKDSQQLLKTSHEKWKIWGWGTVNNIAKIEEEAVFNAIENGEAMGFECLGVFIDGELQMYCFYQLPHDKRYGLFNYLRFNSKLPRFYDYIVFAIGKWFAEQGIMYLNLDSDVGLPILRATKLALGPSNYVRKYSIVPSKLMSIG